MRLHVDEASATDRQIAERASGASRLAWLPIPLAIVVTVAVWTTHPTGAYGSQGLLLLLNFVFTTLGSVSVAFLVGRSFLTRGEPSLLMLGCGALVWGTTGLASTAVGGSDINDHVTIHNLGLCLAATCHLSAALFAIRPRPSLTTPGFWLPVGYGGGMAGLALVTVIGSTDWMPTFFIQGRGGTPLRQLVVGSTVGMFVLAAIVLRVINRRSISRFLHWYTLGLMLTATGLAAVMIQSHFGSTLSWVARSTQYLAGVYLLVAAAVSVKDSKRWRLTIEESLSEARQRYEDLFHMAADAIIVHEASAGGGGRVVRANDAACELLGYSAETMETLSVLDLVAPEERQAAASDVRVTLREGVLRHEKTLLASDGRRIATEMNTRVFRDRGQLMVLAVIRDVTERKRGEEQVRELSQRLTYHVDNSPLAVIEWGPDLRIARWSLEAERLFGWRAEEVLGRRAEEMRWLYEEDAGRVAESNARLVAGEGRGFSSNRNYCKDGSVVHCEWYNSALVDESGQLRSILSLVLDVTARKEAEARLEEAKRLLDALLDNVPEGITIADANLRVQAASRYGRELLGTTPRGMPVSLMFERWKVYQPDGATELTVDDLPLVRAVRNGEIVRDLEVLQANAAGTRLPLLCNAAPIRDSAGRIVGGVVAWRDLTERKRSEERLRQAQKLESIGLLAGGIAHDFNNLLVGVIGNASLAQEMLEPGHPAAELLERVVGSGEHAALLTRQMLAYAGKGRFVVEPIDLARLTAEITDLVKPSIPKKVRLHLDLPSDLPPVMADRGQLQQVVMNLVLNAGEAIGDHVGDIAVRAGCRDVDGGAPPADPHGGELHPGRYVFLEVRDTGCGMDEDTRGRIFDPFFTTKFTGRGLGLSAVSGILRGHNGAIQVSSEPGKGSCFTALFPASSLTPAARPGRGRVEGEPARPGDLVLVVDDEEVVRQLARRVLESHGVPVIEAESAMAALDLLAREGARVSVILLDLSMPGLSGAEALPEFRRLHPGVRVLVSSGFGEDEVMSIFAGQKICGFIQKPYTTTRLLEAVRAALDSAPE
jgi:PAS domain S-box-containing protein